MNKIFHLNILQLLFNSPLFRSSITRLSQQDKIHSTREATVKETIKEEKVRTDLVRDSMFYVVIMFFYRVPPETWNMNLIKSLPLTIRSQVEVNAAFYSVFLTLITQCPI